MPSQPPRMTSVNWRYSSYFIIIPTLLLYVLSLTGCVSNSPGLQNIFLTAIQHRNGNLTTTSTGVQLRVGYFGICVHASTDTTCFVSAMTSLDKLASQLNSTVNLGEVDINQVAALLSVALVLQTKILLPLLAAAGSSFLLGIIVLILFKWAAKRPKVSLTESSAKRLQFYSRGCLGFIWTSVGLSTASAVLVSESIGALQFWTANVPESSIIVSTGTAMQALQWVLVVLSTLFALTFSSMLRVTQVGTLPGPGGNGLRPMGSAMPPAAGGQFQAPGQGVPPPPPFM